MIPPGTRISEISKPEEIAAATTVGGNRMGDTRQRVSFTRPDAEGYRYCDDWRIRRTYGAKGHGCAYNIEHINDGQWEYVTTLLSYAKV
jgi:hypothetical protein